MSPANRLYEFIKEGNIDEAKSLLSSADKVDDAAELLSSLQEAAVKGNVELFDLIVRAGADVKALDKTNKSILMYASKGGSVDIVKLLLSGGADVNAVTKDRLKMTALLLAAEHGHVEVVEVLIGSGASLDAVDGDHCTALMYAAKGGSVKMAELFLAAGADVNALDVGGSVDIVKLLLEAGANVNAVSYHGNTALMFAAEFGDFGVFEVLAAAGASLSYVGEVSVTSFSAFGLDRKQNGLNVLMRACTGGSVEMVKLLLAGGVDVNVAEKRGKTALMFAAEKCRVELVELLLSAGASLNGIDKKNGMTALMYASHGGSVDTVKLLLSAGSSLDESTQRGKTALMFAAEMGHFGVFRFLNDSGASLSAVDMDDYSVLMYASLGGSVDIVKLLLELSGVVGINAVSKWGITALMMAADNSHAGVFELLVGAGANQSAVDQNGLSVLIYACRGGSVEITKLLLAGGVDVNVATKKGRTALMTAADGGYFDVVELLEGAGVSVNAVDEDSLSALMYASMRGSVRTTTSLLAAGADVNVVSKKGKTALMFASDGDCFGVVELLVGAGANVNAVDEDCFSALMYASKHYSVDTVKLLLTARADTNVVSKKGKTALMLAADKSHSAFAELLVGAGANVNAVDEDSLSALMYASMRGGADIVNLLLAAGADVNVVSKRGKKTALMFAVSEGHAVVFELLVRAGASLSVDGILTVAPVFTMQQYRKYKEAVCTSDLLTLKVLQNNHNDIWCLLVQVTDIAGIEDLVRGIVEKHPELVDAKDVKGRAAVDMATPVLRQTINSVRLWFGKYRPMSGKPEHTSSTCFVIKCMDESVEGEPVAVALKLMRVRAQFERETAMRKFGFDGDYVMIQTESYPNRPLTESDPAVVEVSSAELTGVLTKAVAERLYCVVMPFADRNMFVAMKQERFAGKEDVSEVVTIFSQLVKCVMHMHGKGVLHGDIKPMNLVRMGAKWLLIDLDACCVLGRDSVGFKSSSAYIPPEAVLCDAVGGVVKVKSESECREYGVSPLVAHESFDVWSLGCILYQLCSEGVLPLFAANQDDNLNIDAGDCENSLWSLCEWSEKLKASKLSRVLNQQAKNLLSLMLSKDPLKRPSLSRVLSHPFLSGRSYGRVAGEEAAAFDVFISYRVSTDLKHAARLYDMLTGAGLRVWWDKKCLESGKEWQKGFCEGLGNSRSFVCFLSSAGTDVPFQSLGAESACDNVLLEHRLALELKAMDFVQFVFPLMIGDAASSDDAAAGDGNQLSEYKFTKNTNAESVLSVEDALRHHLDDLGLGTPLNHKPSVSEIVSGILACNGYFIGGRPANTFETAVQGIVDTLMKKQSSSSVTDGGVGVDGDPMRSSKSVSSLRSAVNDNRQQVGREAEACGSVSVEEYNRVIAERDSAMVERDELLRRLALEVKLNAVV